MEPCDVCGAEPAYLSTRIGYRKGTRPDDLRVIDVRHYCLDHHPDADLIRSLFAQFESSNVVVANIIPTPT